MTKRFGCLLAAVCMLLCCPGAHALHTYLNIPYEGATPRVVEAILLAQHGVPLEMAPHVWTGSAHGLHEFGYTFDFHCDFGENNVDVYRIRLISSQPSRFDPQQAAVRIACDVAQFVDMERQLVQRFGQPDMRYFKTSRMNSEEKYICYMFEDGCWTAEAMRQVCEADGKLKAYSVWGNVVLELNIDLIKPNVVGKLLSYITLYYYPNEEAISFMKGYDVLPYPQP